ncbi:MAG: TIGR03668 family PPOX class F420-dependent oxidoreductase [Acidobacteriota bacterium]|nr:TIGR03668 family PPOX class F420-dependent oxidoreductase [Acidobacteriota bacterium]
MTEDATTLQLFASATVARLATVGSTGAPHLVPITFALLDERTLVSAVDHKPKRTRALRRLANIEANPRVSVLVDHYEDDWTKLWWARADGHARVCKAAPAGAAEALAQRYADYRARPPAGPFIVVEVERLSCWRAAYSAHGSNPLQQ